MDVLTVLNFYISDQPLGMVELVLCLPEQILHAKAGRHARASWWESERRSSPGAKKGRRLGQREGAHRLLALVSQA